MPPGPVQPIPGEALLSSVILSILLTLAVGSVRMLQLRRLAKRPPVVERRRRGCPLRRTPHLREMS